MPDPSILLSFRTDIPGSADVSCPTAAPQRRYQPIPAPKPSFEVAYAQALRSVPDSHRLSKLKKSTFEAQREIIDDYLLISLLKLHLNDPAPVQPSTTPGHRALQKTHDFLYKNGKRSEALQTRLITIAHRFNQHLVLLICLRQKSPQEIIQVMHKGLIKQYFCDFSEILPCPNRLDKRNTGLNHTLIKAINNRWYELLKSYDLSNIHDKNTIGNIHSDVLMPTKRTQLQFSGKFKSILGTGGYGKVIPALDLLTQRICAAKKIKHMKRANSEFDNSQKLRELLTVTVARSFLLADGFSQTIAARDFKQKAYLFSELSTKGDEHVTELKNLTIRARGDIGKFQHNHYQQTKLYIDLVTTLEQHNLVHPDLKPNNVIGKRLADLDDLLYEAGAVKINTPQYTLPKFAAYKGKVLHGVNFDTYNRFSLGAMLFSSISGQHPTSKILFQDVLDLPRNYNGYYKRGYNATQLKKDLPKIFASKSLTPYESKCLKFAQLLMAKNRTLVTPEKLDLYSWLKQLESLRAYVYTQSV